MRIAQLIAGCICVSTVVGDEEASEKMDAMFKMAFALGITDNGSEPPDILSCGHHIARRKC